MSNSNLSCDEISIIGLGKLGSPMAAVLASKGLCVIGVDKNVKTVNKMRAGEPPVEETNLKEFINKAAAKLQATTDCEHAVLNTNISFIIVPTPSNQAGVFSNEYILEAITEVGNALRKKSSYHLVVITSTVMPGSMVGIIQRTLEDASGRRINKDSLGLCYNPEFIALGSVIDNMLNPDFVLIGESDDKAGHILQMLYKKICDNDPQIQRMNFVNAELTKMSVNTFITAKISYANMLSEICEHLPSADAHVVTTAVGLDKRIGGKYLTPALGYGGPCFPRDNIAFNALAKTLDIKAEIAEAADKINQRQVQRLIGLIKQNSSGKNIAILGLAYKPNTSVVEESQGIELANQLFALGYKVCTYDPMANLGAHEMLHAQVEKANMLQEALKNKDLIIIMVAWPQFKTRLAQDMFYESAKNRTVIIDVWRLLPWEKFSAITRLIYLGRNMEQKLLQEDAVV